MASPVSFSNVGSGIDFSVIRSAILTARSQPITALQQKITNITSKSDAMKQLQNSITSLNSSVEALTSRSLGTVPSATSSDASIFTSSAASGAAFGTTNITVSRLATSLSQATRVFTSKTEPILAGGATTATFELRKGGAATGTAITIDSTNNTLEGLRDAINAANAGVSAAIVDTAGDGAHYKLVLNSTETGTSGRVELAETTTTGSLADFAVASLNPPDSNFANLDASLELNGLAVTRSSNTIADALPGVTLTLKKAGSASVTVGQGNDIEAKLRSFVASYNAIQDFVAGQYKKDTKNRPTGVLAGDTTLRNIQKELRSAVTLNSNDNGGAFSSLTELGITFGDDGKLNFDSATLTAKMASNPEDVKALLYGKTTSDTGLFENFKSVTESITTGIIQTTLNNYQSSITNIANIVTRKLEALDAYGKTLARQFSVADAAIGQLNAQQSALKSVVDSFNSNSDN